MSCYLEKNCSRILCTLLYGIALSLAGNAFASTQTNTRSIELVHMGKKIYLEGILPDGKALQARSAGNTLTSGTQLTCVSCHRRSGLGSSEGGQHIPPVAGKILFTPRTQERRGIKNSRLSGAGARPAYTEQSLRMAITAGIAHAGHQLNPLMPRFLLSDHELEALIAYLRSLDTSPAPGITDAEINIATIVGPDVPDKQSSVMLKTLQAYFNDFNAQTRGEQRRADHSPWHKTWHYGSYRSIKLHSWKLQGPAKTWQQQLTGYYKKQPVYAVLNGISTKNWQPVHEFCEHNQIPCLFPTTSLPVTDKPGHYSIYFSGGINLETASLIKYLDGKPQAGNKKIIQLYQDDAAGQSASKSLQDSQEGKITSIRLPKTEDIDTEYWHTLFQKHQPDTLVLWTNSTPLDSLSRYLASAQISPQIFLSTSFLKADIGSLPKDILDKTYLISRFALAKKQQTHLMRMIYWAKPRKISTDEVHVVANAYFSATMFGSAIKKMRAYLTREYLLERFEHMLENNVFNSVYPGLSLGPDQRFASKGCYIIGPLSHAGTDKTPAPAKWITPHIEHK